MKARSDRDRVIVGVLIVPLAFEQFAEGNNGGRWLLLCLVDPAGESVRQLVAVALVDESSEGERLFPKHIDHIFKTIGSFLDEALMRVEWIRLVAIHQIG